MSTFRSYAEEFRRALKLSRWLTPDDENFPEEFIAASGARRIAAIMRRFKPENV